MECFKTLINQAEVFLAPSLNISKLKNMPYWPNKIPDFKSLYYNPNLCGIAILHDFESILGDSYLHDFQTNQVHKYLNNLQYSQQYY